jgi:hypothetical protein
VNSGDELMVIAIAEALDVAIRIFSSAGEARDRVFSPSSPSGLVPEMELGHIVEWHYRSVV